MRNTIKKLERVFELTLKESEDDVFSKLFEQTIRGNRVYYHGSPSNFDSFSVSHKYHNEGDSSELDVVFLSTNKQFTIDFVKRARNGLTEEATLYTCRLLKPLDLFNTAARSDWNRIIARIDSSQDLEEITQIKKMSNPRYWRCMEESSVIRAIRKAGFDGFCTQEEGVENIAIFDSSSVKILKKENVKELLKKEKSKFRWVIPDNDEPWNFTINKIEEMILDELSSLSGEYVKSWSESFYFTINSRNRHKADKIRWRVSELLTGLYKRAVKNGEDPFVVETFIRRFIVKVGLKSK